MVIKTEIVKWKLFKCIFPMTYPSTMCMDHCIGWERHVGWEQPGVSWRELDVNIEKSEWNMMQRHSSLIKIVLIGYGYLRPDQDYYIFYLD